MTAATLVDRCESSSRPDANLSSQSNLSNPPSNNPQLTLDKVLQGQAQSVCFDGMSQYASGGQSACGLIAMNYIKTILRRHAAGVKDVALALSSLTETTVQEIMSIAQRWHHEYHLEVDEIFRLPCFEAYLTPHPDHTIWDSVGIDPFQNIVRQLGKLCHQNSTVGVVITRPPEIIACVCIATHRGSVFLVFDSHPRPDQRDGAHIFACSSALETVQFLEKLFAIDRGLLSEPGLQWQAQLLEQVSAHFFTAANPPPDEQVLEHRLLCASIETLSLQSALEAQRTIITGLRAQLQTEATRIRQLQADLAEERTLSRSQRRQTQSDLEKQNSILQSQAQADATQIRQLQFDIDELRILIRSQLESGDVQTEQLRSNVMDNHRGSDVTGQAHECDLHAPSCGSLIDAQLARDLDRFYQAEHDSLARERGILRQRDQERFYCEICMEVLSNEAITRIEPCSHVYCRDCIREHILSNIKDGRSSIPCPGCQGVELPAGISVEVIELVGLSEDDYNIFQKLQLSEFMVEVHCRKCNNTVPVDREEYRTTEQLECPLPQCDHIWCKSCQQTIERGGPNHSCDGSVEMDHLMRQNGWKRCPGCDTPTQKAEGCNHMTCITPGCNTHFCYHCGETIVRARPEQNVDNALRSHYRRCTMFEHQ